MSIGNALTLWDEALPPEQLPPYPSWAYLVAAGGEPQHFIESEERITDTRAAVFVGQRPAEPGEYLRDASMRYVPDWTENLQYRKQVELLAAKDEDYRKLQWIFCKSSILYYINTFCWIQDPWAPPDRTHIPFVTFAFQDDVLTFLVWAMRQGQDAVIEKSREMGATWMSQALDTWLANFYNGATLYNSSLTEDEVDNRSPDSLLGKFRYIQSALPEWMRGGWAPDTEGVDIKLKIRIPDTGAIISGEKVKSTMGRGGRALKMNVDEFAFVDSAPGALKALSSLAKSVFFISTPNGAGNAFYHIAHDPAVIKKTLHWSIHPLKNPEWAKVERSNPKYYDDATWDQEHEIRYETSVVGRVFPQLISFAGENDRWLHVRDDALAAYDPAYDVYTSTDFGISDPCATVFAQIKPTPPEVARMGAEWLLVFFDEFEERGMSALDVRYLLNSKPYRYRDHVGDWRSAQQRDSGGKTWEKRLADREARPEFSRTFRQLIHPGPPVLLKGKRSGEKETITLAQERLATPGAIAFSRSGTPHLVRAVQNWSFPLDPNTGLPATQASPQHDQWSHKCKAFIYLLDWLYGTGGRADAQKLSTWNFPARRVAFR